MSLTMYQATVPAMLQTLTAVSAILDKAAAHCDGRKIDPVALTSFRLYPDMHPFNRQIHIMTDLCKGLTARLAGSEVPSWPDVETTFPELKARIAKAVDYLKSFKPEQIDGTEDKTITIKIAGNDKSMTGAQYAFNFVLPNFYFHATTCYAILRHCGLELGKRDFMGAGLL